MITFSTGYFIFLTVISLLKPYSLWFHLGYRFCFHLLTQNILWKWNLIIVSFDWDYRWRVLISVFSSKQIQYLKTDRANLKLVENVWIKWRFFANNQNMSLRGPINDVWEMLVNVSQREVIGNVFRRNLSGWERVRTRL